MASGLPRQVFPSTLAHAKHKHQEQFQADGKAINEKDRTLLMTTILAAGVNLGLTKMAESCREVQLRQTVLAAGLAPPR